MLNITLEYDGRSYNPDSAEWINEISKTVESLSRLTEKELDELAGIVVKGNRENVRAGNDVYGNALLPLMPSTIARKGSSRPLIDTGSMLQNLSTEAFPNIREITADMDYSIYHMTGTKNMTARPWFGFSPHVDNLINQYVNSIGYITRAA